MSDVLFRYQKIEPTTWVYLASLLTIVIYFKFSRLWSIRNLDLISLILLAPGVILIHYGESQQRTPWEQLGYGWVFSISFVFLIRLLIDPMMVRRPLLEPNLQVGGMTCLGATLLLFLMANVVNSKNVKADTTPHGPGFLLVYSIPNVTTQVLFPPPSETQTEAQIELRRDEQGEAVAKTICILSHIAIVVGMIWIGFRHFDNIRTGIAAATLYLLIPYTAQMTGSVDHALPAAMMVWGIAMYRRPLVAGILVGLAAGMIYYPIFLFPLWLSFYWRRGLWRFVSGAVITMSVLLAVLMITSPKLLDDLQQMFNLIDTPKSGFWSFEFVDPVYRWPVMAAFFCLAGALTLWPAQKNLGTLMSCSAAVMLGSQFWHTQRGGLYMAWYLPLLLLTIFRPNLEDRVALSVLGEGGRSRRAASGNEQAA